MRHIISQTAKTAKRFHKDVKVQTGIALGAAFAFVIAFSWNEFMKEAVTSLVLLVGIQNTILLKLLVAIVATAIGVLGIRYFAKQGQK